MLLLHFLILLPFALAAAPSPTRAPGRSSPILSVATPLSQQLQIPARVKQDFSFTFSPSTFDLPSNPSPSLSYTASPLPRWLSFESTNRTFWGIPTSDDEGFYSIGLTARTTEGSIGVDTLTVTVSSRPGGLNLTLPIKDQLLTNNSKSIASVYPYPANSPNFPGVRIPPNWSFSIGLQTWTFTTLSGSKVFYTASLADGSPLPDWLIFNNSTVTFDGFTPKVSRTTTIQVKVGASDVVGFQEKSDSFNITISPHEFSPSPGSLLVTGINITADGSRFDIPLDLVAGKALCLDGKPITDKDLSSSGIKLDTSSLSWLSYNSANSSLGGTPPKDLAGQSSFLPLNLLDRYGDVLNTSLKINFVSSAFLANELPAVDLVPGVEAKIPLDQYILGGPDGSKRPIEITATFTPSSASTFLTLSPDHVLHGNVPDDIGTNPMSVNLRAVDPHTNAISTATLPLVFASAPKSNLTTLPHAYGLSKPATIAIAVVGSIIGSLLLLSLLLLLYRRCCLGKRSDAKSKLEDGQPSDGHDRASQDTRINGDWQEHEYKAETPAMEYSEKFGAYEPPSAKSLVGRSEGEQREHDVIAMAVTHLTTGSARAQRDGDAASSQGQGGSKRFLINPFAKRALRPRPKISNPIVMPSFSNAAFQAQLAAAVDSAGIVNRGQSTYSRGEETGHDVERDQGQSQVRDDSMLGTSSGLTDSVMLVDQSILSSINYTDDAGGSGAGSSRSGGVGGVGEESYDRSMSSTMTGTDDSQFNERSSRASWESEPPFSWTQPISPKTSSEGYDTMEASEDSHLDEGTMESAGGMSEPTQRSEFRPNPGQQASSAPAGAAVAIAVAASAATAAVTGNTAHRVVTPADPTEEGISIDNIHFPTDSDIALTEASSDHEVAAVITTAARIDARRTLDSPASTSSPASSHTEKASSYIYASYPKPAGGSGFTGTNKSMGTPGHGSGSNANTPSPVMTTHSRLVSFGKEKTVRVTNPGTPSQEGTVAGKRMTSQTAVVVDSRSMSTNASSIPSASGSGVGSVAMGSEGSSAYEQRTPGTGTNGRQGVVDSARPRARSTSKSRKGSSHSNRSRSSSRSPSPPLSFRSEDSATPQARPPMPLPPPSLPTTHTGHTSSSSPPVSLPSLPALPSLTNVPPRTQTQTQMVQRILLGVAEPFHFYPPLTLTPSPSIASTNTSTGTDVSKPSSKPGASYHAFIEKKVLHGQRGKDSATTTSDKLPAWLRFEDMELWGVPAEADRGVWSVRVVERLGGQEKVVGRFALEVVGR